MAALALTVLLVILWLAFVGVGYWHGGWRQAILLAAMLLSYAVLSEWAVPNGRDLSTQFHWTIARTTTGIALLYLLAGTFVLGFLGSFALYRPRPLGPTERRLGAVMGVLNGGLLLALVLRTVRSYAFAAGRGQSLHESALSRLLIEDVGYLLLVALVIGGVAAVIGLVMARRDEAHEMALLASVAVPAMVIPTEPLHDAQPAPLMQPAPPPPTSQPTPPPIPPPVYATAPLIDWPTGPPPGTHHAPPAIDQPPKPDAPPLVATKPPTSLPAQPQLPPRVPPPMVYPIADLIAAHTHPEMPAVDAPSPVTSPPGPPPNSTPPSTVATARPARPVGPPPGATHPAFVPPTVLRPPTLPAPQETIRADGARELPLSPPPPLSESPPPVVPKFHPPTEERLPPVVRELDVITHDPPIARNDAAPAHDATTVAVQADTDGGTMPSEKPMLPPSRTPNAAMATTAIPTIVPPPLPPMLAMLPATPVTPPLSLSKNDPPTPSDRGLQGDEVAKARAGFARVAVARQMGSKPDDPSSSPSPPSPDPLQPPLPTGPRVHPCPTCGYPVRDHARYCPNCGSRQGR